MISPTRAADSLVIGPLDVHDDVALQGWYAVYAAADRHDREDTATTWTLPELTVMLRDDSPRQVRQTLVADDAGAVVGVATFEASTVDNPDAAQIEIGVRPDRRGEGVGSALLAAIEDVAGRHGRRLLQSQVAWPYDADPAGRGHRDLEFARRRGFRLGLVDIQRQLALPVDPGLLDGLADQAASHHPAYEIRAWSGRVPDDIVDSWAALVATLVTEAPTGGMTREDEALDAAAVREGEALADAQGRRKYNATALDAAGEVVAYTDVATTRHEPGRAYQWGTLVRHDHRGHRLGTAVKVANLRLLATERPDLTTLRTWNAEVNSHMVGVNERLGFVPVERMGELEKRLL